MSCLLGFHTSVLSLSVVHLPLNLSLIYFNGTCFSKTLQRNGVEREDVQIRVFFCLEAINVSPNVGSWRLVGVRREHFHSCRF